MQQTCIYDYLNIDEDPLFQLISDLKKDEIVTLGKIEVYYNLHGLYEVVTPESHESSVSVQKCYELVKDFCNKELSFD